MMAPMLHPGVFPDKLLEVLKHHMRNPKASSSSDPKLLLALRQFDEDSSGQLLNELPDGEKFVFNGAVFRKIKKRRTRVLCEKDRSPLRYLISGSAIVQKA